MTQPTMKKLSNSCTRSSPPLVWDASKHVWNIRKQASKIVALMYNVLPSDSEGFHLRLPFFHIVGATRFANLRIYKGITYTILKKQLFNVVYCLVILSDNSAWNQISFQLRQLFSYICIFPSPQNAL